MTTPQLRPALKTLSKPIYIPMGLYSVGSGMLVPVLPIALKAQGLSYLTISIVLAGAGVGSLMGQLPVGRALAKHPERRLLALGFLVTSLAIAPLGVASAASVLVLLRTLSGLSSSAIVLSLQTYLTRAVQPDVRGRAMSFLGGTNRLAFLFAPLIGGYLAQEFGFSVAFVAASVVTVSGLAVILRARWLDPPEPQSPETAEASGSVFAVFSKNRRTLASAGSAQLCLIGVRYGRLAILPLTGEVIGLNTGQIGVLIAIGSAADLILFPVAGILMDRFGRLAATVPSMLLLAVGLFVLSASSTHLMVVISATIIGVGNGLGAGTMMTLSSDLAPAESPSEFLAALGTIRDSGRIVGPLLVGALADSAGLGPAAAALGAVSLLGVAVLVLLVGETKPAI